MQASQQLLFDARTQFDAALLQARRDGWSLRALADNLNLSYTSVKRYAQRAEARGQ